MDIIRITGSKKLEGEVQLQGSKNSALPILAACVSVNGISVIHNCPSLTDVDAAVKILEYLGCRVTRRESALVIDSSDIKRSDIPQHLMHEMRSSIVFLAPLLSRFGSACVSTPGGCEIGLRPIDLHLNAMRKMGAVIEEESGILSCSCPNGLSGAKIVLSFPSVGATENIMIAAATAKGTTVLVNAAREPEIRDLAVYLNSCGAKIKGAGEGTIVIEGVESLHGTEHSVIPDRIVASTFMAAAAATGGKVLIKGVVPSHITPVISAFEEAGCRVDSGASRLYICAPKRLGRVQNIRTMPYPGFPTDSQAIVMAMLCTADGTSMLIENIFENRFRHVQELRKLGAKIDVEGRVAVVEGVESLKAAHVYAPDLRGGAALIVAGLAAQGVTEIENVRLIDRGWQDIEKSLSALGADIVRTDESETAV
ncbi:MAG: UDP-N-acetylglucosamine 1-carboxyvinyltransferase [Acutalibacteraceae bacterium]